MSRERKCVLMKNKFDERKARGSHKARLLVGVPGVLKSALLFGLTSTHSQDGVETTLTD
jgi:hypothetical protein